MDLSKLYNCICATRMRHPTSIIDYMDLSKLYNCIYATRMRHPTLIKHVRVISEYNHHSTQSNFFISTVK